MIGLRQRNAGVILKRFQGCFRFQERNLFLGQVRFQAFGISQGSQDIPRFDRVAKFYVQLGDRTAG